MLGLSEPSSAGPMTRQGRAMGAEYQPCHGIVGAGTDDSKGVTWGPEPWAGWENPTAGSWAGT